MAADRSPKKLGIKRGLRILEDSGLKGKVIEEVESEDEGEDEGEDEEDRANSVSRKGGFTERKKYLGLRSHKKKDAEGDGRGGRGGNSGEEVK